MLDLSTLPTANKCSSVAEMGDRWVTIDMGRKLWGYDPFGRGAGSPRNTLCGLDRGLVRNKWHLDLSSRLAPTGMGQNLGVVPLGVELGLHLTQCCPGRGLLQYQVAS